MRKVWVLLLVMLLCREICFGEEVNSGANWSKFDNKILTLLNEPEIGGVAEFKITAKAVSKDKEMEIICSIPKNWEIINIQGYEIKGQGVRSVHHPDREQVRICFWKGYMPQGEVKEIFFQARIPDGEDYQVFVDIPGYGECFELDLGQPEPPDFRSLKQRYQRGSWFIYEVVEYPYPYAPEKKYTKQEEIPFKENQYPPILGELMTRTKHIPYVGGGMTRKRFRYVT